MGEPQSSVGEGGSTELTPPPPPALYLSMPPHRKKLSKKVGRRRESNSQQSCLQSNVLTTRSLELVLLFLRQEIGDEQASCIDLSLLLASTKDVADAAGWPAWRYKEQIAHDQ